MTRKIEYETTEEKQQRERLRCHICGEMPRVIASMTFDMNGWQICAPGLPGWGVLCPTHARVND
jgi:formylmethanofuran dehydrogenase subunit E